MLLLFAGNAIAQNTLNPQGYPQSLYYKWYKYSQYVTADSGIGLPVRDTNFIPYRNGFITQRSNGDVYVYISPKWVLLLNKDNFLSQSKYFL